MDTQVQEAVQTAPSNESMLLSVRDVCAGYDESLILKGVSIDVPEKKAVALLGRLARRTADRWMPGVGSKQRTEERKHHFALRCQLVRLVALAEKRS